EVGTDVPHLPLPDGAKRVSGASDRVAYEEPLAGAQAGLVRVRRDHAVLVAADMPGVSAELLGLMAGRAAPDRKATVLIEAGGRRPLPALVAVAPALALARTLLEGGERRLRALIEGLEAEGLPEAAWASGDPVGAWRRDVDLPEDVVLDRRYT